MIYYTIYLILAVLILLTVGAKGKKQRYIEFIAVVIVVLFQGLRWENGTDWDSYYNMFMYPADPIYYNEYGWWLLNNIIQTNTGSYTVMLIVQCTIIVMLNIKFARHAGLNNVTSVIFGCFAGSIFPVRFAMASGIIMVGFRYIVERNFFKFLIYVVIASTIHIASILIIPFYFIPHKPLKLITMMLMYIGSIIIGFATASVHSVLDSINSLLSIGAYAGDIQDKIDGYMSGGIGEYSIRSVKSIVLSFCSGAFFICLYYYFRKNYFNNTISSNSYQNILYTVYLNLYVFGICFNRAVAFTIPYLSRIGILASASAGLLLLLGLEKKFKRKSNLLFVYLIYIVYKFILFTQTLHGQYESLFIPYNCVI